MSTPNWESLSKQTQELQPKVRQITETWFQEHTDWDGWVIFCDYPPRFMARFEIIHINQLSDKRLQEVGEVVTLLCNECGLLCRKFWKGEPAKNRVEYKFWLPINC